MGCILGFAPHPPGGVKVPEPKIRHPKWDAPTALPPALTITLGTARLLIVTLRGCSSVVERHVANGTTHYKPRLKSLSTHSEPRFLISAGSMKRPL